MGHASSAVLGALGAILLAAPAAGISGIEGTFEYAFDAPWRIEPEVLATGEFAYGDIPIQITIHDADLADADQRARSYNHSALGEVVIEPPGPLQLGAFCELRVTHTPEVGVPTQRTYPFHELAEVERSQGRWRASAADPEPSRREVCRLDQGETCPSLAEMARSSEWYALAWHPVPADALPGSSIDLAIDVKIARETGGPCDATSPDHVLTLRNHVSVALARAPLPRFDAGWVYGDLHYHSQGTDNEGEAGHSYRGVVRAMGAMGLDFAFATEHASASDQIIDADTQLKYGVVIEASTDRDALRDMSDPRFTALLGDLHAADGVNAEAALRARGGRLPQSARVNGTAPQIFLGGEVDVIPETAEGYPLSLHEEFEARNNGSLPQHFVPVGNGLAYDIDKLCDGYKSNFVNTPACWLSERLEEAENGFLARDIQGINETDYARLHLVYLPRRSDDAGAFVPSYTGRFGGGSRRLAEPHRGRSALGPEIREHGYAFIAHPMSGLGDGGNAPDSLPWTEHLLEKAFAEPAILGLQLWNENTRYKHKLESGEYEGYERPEEILGTRVPVEAMRNGFYTGQFELDASGFLAGEKGEFVAFRENGLFDVVAHGSYLWDRMNLWGLDPVRTHELTWLAPGEPRRVFMAGGSDAHGDFNYRREGYFLGDSKVTDTAMGTPRNLVHVPVPTHVSGPSFEDATALEEPPSTTDGGGSSTAVMSFTGLTPLTATTLAPGSATAVADGGTSVGPIEGGDVAVEDHGPSTTLRRISQDAVVDALAEGRFAVTDGPALRIVIDRNRNGAIDGADTPMGGVVDLYGEESLPLLIEWRSTSEFGAVDRIDLVVGSASSFRARLYGPEFHGMRGAGYPLSSGTDSYDDAWSYTKGGDQYWRVDGVPLRVPIAEGGALAGLEEIELALAPLVAARGIAGERFFVRAVARTNGSPRRFAYTNPVWALHRDSGTCPEDATRAIDGDGDGLPDGCDPCPESSADLHVCGDPFIGGTSLSGGSQSTTTGESTVQTLRFAPTGW